MVLRITRDEKSAVRATLRLEGRLEGASASLLVGECLALLDRDGAVDVDLSDVVIIDNSGVDALRRLRRSRVTISGCSELVASILEDAGIDVLRNESSTAGADD
jgi:anti-anti-sigma regulatory factor